MNVQVVAALAIVFSLAGCAPKASIDSQQAVSPGATPVSFHKPADCDSASSCMTAAPPQEVRRTLPCVFVSTDDRHIFFDRAGRYPIPGVNRSVFPGFGTTDRMVVIGIEIGTTTGPVWVTGFVPKDELAQQVYDDGDFLLAVSGKHIEYIDADPADDLRKRCNPSQYPPAPAGL